MVKSELMDVLTTALVETARKYGVPNPPAFKQAEWSECVAEFPQESALQHWDSILLIMKDLRKIKGVEGVSTPSVKDMMEEGEPMLVYVEAEEDYWEMSEAEKKEDEEWERYENGDPEIVAKFEAERKAEEAERRKHYKEYLLPVPEPSKTRPTELYLTMAYEPYDQIKSGEKVTEFRAYCETWVKRILANVATLKTVKFQRGYGGPGRPKPEQMIWTIKKIDLYDIDTKESCDHNNIKEGFIPSHIAIDLGERVDADNRP